MPTKTTQDQWLNNVVDQLRALDGVTCETEEGGRIGLKISHDGNSSEIWIAVSGNDYRTHKIQYVDLRRMLTELGIIEGQTYVAAQLPRRPMTPQMRTAREKQKNTFDAWQDVWRTLRKAEKALDVDYEITQMRDYY